MQVDADTPVLLYFAYGSNMSTPRLVSRVASARVVAVARLSAHALKFHKHGRDGSAKCDALYTGMAHNVVQGVVFEIAVEDKPLLDEKEGLGCGYDEKSVMVTGEQGDCYEAITYFATHVDPSLQPFHWYKEHVLRGASEHSLTMGYIAAIRAIESVADPDPDNHDNELSVYGETLLSRGVAGCRIL